MDPRALIDDRTPALARLSRVMLALFPALALAATGLLLTHGTVLMFDLPTTHEEEIAELVFGLCFLLLVWSEWLGRAAKKEGTDLQPVPSSRKRALRR